MVLIGAALSSLPLSEGSLAWSVRDAFERKDPRLVEVNMKALALGERAE
jgi:Pyruvate/2-oxoacid:ferredoxin oxidoreductase gamma subunit